MIGMGKRLRFGGILLIGAFAIWTWMVQCVDVQSVGVKGTNIGFASFNTWFNKLTGVHMKLYVITDWLGLVPIAACMIFGGIGLAQLVKRRSFLKVDRDLIFLGIYYIMVIAGYLIFEIIPINYRPILINDFMEVSYPSSTTLLVLCVMPTVIEQVERRTERKMLKRIVNIFATCFSVFMVLGRLLSGVHWFTDIVGSVILSAGLFCTYKAAVLSVMVGENMQLKVKKSNGKKWKEIVGKTVSKNRYVKKVNENRQT